jgi:outer membrane protein OmpA-like peptidoglycan-associated protein
MKTRTCITLLLSMGLALSAFAQQGNGSAGGPAAAASQTAAASGSQPTSQQKLRNGDEQGAAWLHPFAGKEYVRRHVQSIQNRVNELDELTSTNARTIKDVDVRAQQGIQMASDKASLADAHADDAAGKAQTAQQAANTLNSRVGADVAMVGNLDQYNSGAQTEIRFHAGQTVLSKQAKDALDEVAGQLKNQRGYIIEIQSFCSGQGQTAIANSRKMADSVVRYLVFNHEVPARRIYVIAMGNASETKGAGGTRVEVSLLKNGLEQTARQ